MAFHMEPLDVMSQFANFAQYLCVATPLAHGLRSSYTASPWLVLGTGGLVLNAILSSCSSHLRLPIPVFLVKRLAKARC